MAPVNSKRVAERRRAAAIVEGRRTTIERRFAKMPNASNAADVRRVINLLRQIEAAILETGETFSVPDVEYPGNFSFEEMELAEEIIAEQERNPFEE